jgi:hypothetical protein
LHRAIDTVVVVENIVASLTSSTYFEFVDGWRYVLGAGIIGGMMHHGQSPINEPSRTAQE